MSARNATGTVRSLAIGAALGIMLLGPVVSTRAESLARAVMAAPLEGGPLSWTKEQADTSAGKFTFAVFSGRAGGERDGVFEVAIEHLNQLQSELIMNVGDPIADGTDDVAELEAQWDAFDARAQ